MESQFRELKAFAGNKKRRVVGREAVLCDLRRGVV